MLNVARVAGWQGSIGVSSPSLTCTAASGIRSSASISARERFALLGESDPLEAMFAPGGGCAKFGVGVRLPQSRSSLDCSALSRAHALTHQIIVKRVHSAMHFISVTLLPIFGREQSLCMYQGRYRYNYFDIRPSDVEQLSSDVGVKFA
jgi:hypothetical protein